MVETQSTAERARQFILVVTLHNGDTIEADAGSRLETARSQIGLLHSALGTESFVRLGDDTIVKSQDVRSVQLKDDDGSGSGFLDSLFSRGGGRDMSSYDTQEMQRHGETHTVRSGQSGSRPGGVEDWVGYGRRRFAETKPFFLTSEFLTFVGLLTAVAIALGTNDELNGFRGWLLLAILGAAYMISRGIAKSGTKDPNPTR